MTLQTSMLLGTGGGNGDYDTSEFFDGAVTARSASDAAENTVQASIVVAGYR